MERLNLGAGDWHLEGWRSVDIKECDLRAFPWPWSSDSVDEVFASHILEHFPLMIGKVFLRQCHRILKPGGQIHLAVPDMDKFINCQLKKDFSSLGGYQWIDLNYCMGGDDSEHNPWNKHLYSWCEGSLSWELLKAGFVGIMRRDIGNLDNPAFEAISLYMDAQK
jgi:ubiquinone/menaquinone biosynthesis C-methylase UbiE